jgi:hypothetical protein
MASRIKALTIDDLLSVSPARSAEAERIEAGGSRSGTPRDAALVANFLA